MSIASLTYTPPIRRDAVGRALDYQLLDIAAEQFAAGEFLASAQTVFRHVLPDDGGPDLTAPFGFTQGSSRVSVRIEDGVCFLSVPMARLPAGGGGVAALRYVLSRINAAGQLYQARLRGDDLSLEFREQLSALHPQKLVEVLRRMPVEADQHDDWMESQFGVMPLERGKVEPLDGGDLDEAARIWQIHWDEIEELLKEAQRKRSMFFLNEVTSLAVQRIRFALPLAGSLLPRLLEASSTFNNTNVDPRKRETSMAKCIKEMRAAGGEELRRSLGHVEHAISPFTEGTRARFEGFFGPGNYMTTIEQYKASGQSMEAALPLVGTYYYLLATHTWPAEVRDAMKQGLIATSGKPWREMASILFDHARELLERYGGDEADGEEHEDRAEEAVEEAQ